MDETPLVYPKYAWQVKTDRAYGNADNIESIETPLSLESTHKLITFQTRMKVSFPLSTIRPKVQRNRIVPFKQMPRDVETERKRKLFASINFEHLLDKNNIDPTTLIPVEILEKLFPNLFSSENVITRNFFLPLHWFDNNDYDIFTEIDWLKLGKIDDKQYPLPGMAFIPNFVYQNDNCDLIENPIEIFKEIMTNLPIEEIEKFQNTLYVWRLVAIEEYNDNLNLWIVTDLETFKSFYIHRIYIKFMAEDPFEFIERLNFALELRKKSENIIKFNTVIDVLVLLSKLPFLEKTILQSILHFTNYRGNLSENFQKNLINQVNLNYQRIMIKYEFETFLMKHPRDYPYLHVIQSDVEYFKDILTFSHLDMPEFERKLRFLTLYYLPETVNAMSSVVDECITAEKYLLFSCSTLKTVTLIEFEIAQKLTCNTAVDFFRNLWITQVSKKICSCLRSVGKGWVDIRCNDWYIYKSMKMFKFLAQVKLRMESSLRNFLDNSMHDYIEMLYIPCIGYLNVQIIGYEWTENFLTNPFKQFGPPVFYLTITLSESGYVYSTKPSLFLPKVLQIYHSSLTLLSYISLVDSRVMKNLIFAKNLYLDCGDDIERMYHINHYKLLKSFICAKIPLKAYGFKYNEFVELFILVIPDYIKYLKTLNLTAQEIKELIINEKRKTEELKQILPNHMIIGPFFINVEPLKKFLIDKRQKITAALLEFFTDRMRNITESLIENFLEIYNRLTEKANSIEHVFELKDFILTVPGQIEYLEDKVKVMMMEYDILDFFLHNLSNEQFGRKWEAFAFPYKIFLRIGVSNEQYKNDIDLFKKLQIQELVAFQERLESVNEEVSIFSLNFDPEKANETSVDAKKLWRVISDLQKIGVTLQKRQRLFEMEELSLDFIEQIVNSFKPYYNLWINCVNFLKLEELCMGNALVSLDINDITQNLTELENLLKESVIIFDEKIELQAVAEYFLKLINDFKPILVIMTYLKNENWLPMHWLELSSKAKIDIKYSIALNFHFCIRKGILNFPDLVKDIAERAILEADSIRKAYEEEERIRLEEERIAFERKSNRKCRTDIV